MSANILTVRGFINKIDRVSSNKKTVEPKFFAKVAFAVGEGDGRKTQWISCYVSKGLSRLVQSAYETQTEEDDGKFSNVLGSQFAEITIVNPYFEVNSGGYLDGSGILTSITFLASEPKPKASK